MIGFRTGKRTVPIPFKRHSAHPTDLNPLPAPFLIVRPPYAFLRFPRLSSSSLMAHVLLVDPMAVSVWSSARCDCRDSLYHSVLSSNIANDDLSFSAAAWRCAARTSCLEGYELFRVHPDYFDLVITDLIMSHMSGFDLAGKIKGVRPDIPIISVREGAERVTEERVKAAGICGILLKPLEVQTVALLIREVLDGRRTNCSP